MELTFKEGIELLRQIPEFGDPLPQLILTGGDPLARADLFELIDEACKPGIGVSITPAVTPALPRSVLARLKAHSIEGLGLSLDAPRLIVTTRSGASRVPSTALYRQCSGR